MRTSDDYEEDKACRQQFTMSMVRGVHHVAVLKRISCLSPVFFENCTYLVRIVLVCNVCKFQLSESG